MKHHILVTSILSAVALAANAGAAITKPNTISFTTFPSNTAYTTNKLAVGATATAGTPTFTVTGPATYATGFITLTGTGTVQVVAKEASAPTGYVLPTPVTNSFTVSLASQTITPFNAISDQAYSTNTITITPPTASSGQPVTVTVKSGPASYSATTKKVTITGAGTVVLAANQAGIANKISAADEVTTSFTVSLASQTITPFNAISDQAYSTNTITITPPTSSLGQPVTVTVKSGPASYSATTKKVTITGVGTVVLAANQAGVASKISAADEVTTSFSISQSSQTIAAFTAIAAKTWSPTLAAIAVTAPTSTSKLPVTLSVVSGPGTISSNKVTATGAGTIVIAADQAGNDKYAAASQVTTSIVVNKGSNSLTAFGTTTPASPKYGASFTIPVPTGKSTASVIITASGASVSQSGATATITPTAKGTVTVYANQAGDDNWADATQVSKTVTVAAATSVITPDSNKNLTFSPSVGNVTVSPTSTSSGAFTFSTTGTGGTVNSSTGVVTITGAGTLVVKATQAASTDGNYAAVTPAVTVCTITIAKGIQTLNTPPSIPTPADGTSFYLPAATSDQGVALTYGVTGATYATTTRKVTVTAVGTISISASALANANYNALASTPVKSFTATKKGSVYTFSSN